MKNVRERTTQVDIGPLVSIGVPVHNGEAFLDQALWSLRGQTYENLEIIISDNASTDETAAICRRHAEEDRRIRYYYSATNRGAAWNFNRVVELARGEYFKWAAHDDLVSPSYVAECVRVLERDPTAVLCCTAVREIDASGAPIRDHRFPYRVDSPRTEERFFDLVLAWHNCYYVFGLIRKAALDATPLMGNYSAGDAVLIAQLGLLGRFCQLDELGFFARSHAGQSMQVFNKFHTSLRGMDAHSYTAWFDPRRSQERLFPHWRLLSEYGKSLWSSPLSLRASLICHYVIARWAYRFRRHLALDLVRGSGILGMSR